MGESTCGQDNAGGKLFLDGVGCLPGPSRPAKESGSFRFSFCPQSRQMDGRWRESQLRLDGITCSSGSSPLQDHRGTVHPGRRLLFIGTVGVALCMLGRFRSS